jgi:hypothetical protein
MVADLNGNVIRVFYDFRDEMQKKSRKKSSSVCRRALIIKHSRRITDNLPLRVQERVADNLCAILQE